MKMQRAWDEEVQKEGLGWKKCAIKSAHARVFLYMRNSYLHMSQQCLAAAWPQGRDPNGVEIA